MTAAASVSLYDIPLRRIDGTPATLGEFRGKVLLIVNVASKCGLTPQYAALEKLYESHRDRGLVVLGFPANDFGAQEPGTNEEILAFCTTHYGVQFPMFAKISVKGPDMHPLYRALVAAWPRAEDFGDDSFEKRLASYGIRRENPSELMWNFKKFLVSRDGRVIGRFVPGIAPDDPRLGAAIKAALG